MNWSNNINLFLKIKEEFTEHLIDTLTPHIYEGLSSIYKCAVNVAKKSNANDKILLIFQKMLESIKSWNQMQIDEETQRIKEASNTKEYLDELIRAVIKSNIILLTCSNNLNNIIGSTFYQNFTTARFIHVCYIECAKDAHNNPYLFYHDVAPMDLKRNQIIVQQNIQNGIIRAIRKVLPIASILKEYLANTISIIPELPAEDKKGNQMQVGQKALKLIHTEDIKTEQQKIQEMINLDKIIANMAPSNPPASEPPKVHSNKQDKAVQSAKNVKSNRKEDDQNMTSLSSRPSLHPENIERIYTTDKIDLQKVTVIEDYGK